MLSVRLNILKSRLKVEFGLNSFQRLLQLPESSAKNPTIAKFLLHLPKNTFFSSTCHLTTESSEKFASKDPNVFGDIAGKNFEELPLEQDEIEQEEFEKAEASVPRYMKPSAGQYANMIKEHITKGDLKSALGVLDLVKQNRDKPTTYMYTLLLRAFAVQGHVKKTYQLYTDMKKRALKVNAAAYTSLINACANCANSSVALDYLEKVREHILLKNVVLNEAHYNALVKAYGRHKKIVQAFQVIDEMIDNRVSITEGTFNSLLYASISDKENGLRHSLVVWHMMQKWRKKPDLVTYHLMLRAIRDTKLGNLKVNDLLLPDAPTTQVVISDSLIPDLLSRTPIVSTDVLTWSVKQIEAKKEASVASQENNQEIIKAEEKKENTELVTVNQEKVVNIKLENIHKKNKLILFGGFHGFLKRMENDGVQPDAKTMTLLLDVIPDSLAAENTLLDTARKNKITLDIDFFNMLIKKRSFRKDYKEAKEILDELHRHNLVPDMITWGVLALGCQSLDEAKVLLEGMELSGHTLNPVIAGSFLGNACCGNKIDYILEIMQLMMYKRIRPTEHIYTILDKYKAATEDKLKYNKKSRAYRNPKFRTKFEVFKNRYEKMQALNGRDKLHAHLKERRTIN